MTKLNRRHLQDQHKTEIAKWIMEQTKKPSWQDVSDKIERLFNIDRQPNTIMRDEVLKSAMKARARVPSPKTNLGKPTAKKFEALAIENDRLKVRIAELEDQAARLIEQRIHMLNYAASRNIPEKVLYRHLPAIDRNRTRLDDE